MPKSLCPYVLRFSPPIPSHGENVASGISFLIDANRFGDGYQTIVYVQVDTRINLLFDMSQLTMSELTTSFSITQDLCLHLWLTIEKKLCNDAKRHIKIGIWYQRCPLKRNWTKWSIRRSRDTQFFVLWTVNP